MDTEKPPGSCNTNSKFNFTVGALAIAAALVIGYFVYGWLMNR